MPTLSPNLARQNPEGFKAELVGGLKERSVYGKHLWDAVVSANLIRADSLHINPSQWASRSNAQRGDIHLGTAPLDAHLREQLIFSHQAIDYEDEVTLRFLHELGHLFEASRIRLGSDRIQDILGVARAVRSIDQNLGLSAIGSLSMGGVPFYGDDMKWREDNAEMTAMYTLDPNYLRCFLGYVDKAESAPMLNRVGVTSVPGQGRAIFEAVEAAVQEGIVSN